ncbi:MAG: integrase arm-type DNA-binding domain-containing protein [Paralcaligenes sp.]
MSIEKLNAVTVQNAGPRLRKKNPSHEKDFAEYALGDGSGLHLIVKPTGNKSWAFIYKSKVTGNQEKIGLGGYPVVTLANARLRAQAQRDLMGRGLDPKQERDKAKLAIRVEREKPRHTFERLAFDWPKSLARIGTGRGGTTFAS